MELNDALRIPLAPSDVWDALQDLALLRASLDNCESFHRFAHGEYALTMTVPLGPLRARYEVRAHLGGAESAQTDALHRNLSFKARADGLGSLRGQLDVSLRTDDHVAMSMPSTRQAALDAAQSFRAGTRIDYSVWATATGPLAELPARQIENALHDLADEFFTEFCAVVQAKHGQGPNRARGSHSRRQHVFLRPINLGALARRSRQFDHGGTLTGRATGTLLGARTHDLSHRPPGVHAVPGWAWAGMIFFVALLLYLAGHFGLGGLG
ncbi:SRPBCC domain-containing protein [Paraburkholderia sp.]|uniref:CoxG family protein n=1 Tax=Paraburkholderia sp. TaxID=1926495 RepID=UPI00238E4CCF|nr:SRPBCC domain-containing protein [Paraburkholderia sp.]MDE1183165.1 SRPBCC domain-containing protein [Paraburkholderia sp.]